MKIPPIPFDEAKRLKSLENLCILDTLPEERFDRITRLAARALNVPIALVSLVDRDRQWFKSKQGLSACETRRDISFCGHAILHEETLVVRDAKLDDRFADNPLVVGEPFIRFYAGHPIHSPDGSRIGTLCVIDQEPRPFSEQDRELLADLAGTVERELSLTEKAASDELTALANWRGFVQVGQYILGLCRRNHLPAAVIAIDLDDFKSVNDSGGHEAGNEVLRAFGTLLQKNFRESDVVARLEADKFAVLCSGTTAAQLEVALKRLRKEFAESQSAARHPQLSWSVGVALFDPSTEVSVEALQEIADARMHFSKVSKINAAITA